MNRAADILLVEDNPHDLELALRLLRKHRLGSTVGVARDGVEALEYVFGAPDEPRPDAAARPKIIFLDLRLPKVDGIEVLRRLKSDALTRVIPVVLLLSSERERDALGRSGLPVDHTVVKPISFESFARAVSDAGLYWMVQNRRP